jgi:hypothetical protein
MWHYHGEEPNLRSEHPAMDRWEFHLSQRGYAGMAYDQAFEAELLAMAARHQDWARQQLLNTHHLHSDAVQAALQDTSILVELFGEQLAELGWEIPSAYQHQTQGGK